MSFRAYAFGVRVEGLGKSQTLHAQEVERFPFLDLGASWFPYKSVAEVLVGLATDATVYFSLRGGLLQRLSPSALPIPHAILGSQGALCFQKSEPQRERVLY